MARVDLVDEIDGGVSHMSRMNMSMHTNEGTP